MMSWTRSTTISMAARRIAASSCTKRVENPDSLVNMMKSTMIRQFAGALLMAGLVTTTVHLIADVPAPVLLILDRDALDHGPPPHPIPGEAVNDLIASVGVRDQLPYFTKNIGAPLTLLGGQNGSVGWFEVRRI